MTERLAPKLEEIYRLVDSDRYDEAMERIAALDEPERSDPIVLLYRALCAYERKNDLECMRLLASFVSAAPKHIKVPYALYTFAVCLQNLDLNDEALTILRTLPKKYPDLEAALASSEAAVATRKTALEIFDSLRRRG